MGFLDKAKKLAEQAQTKLDEVQKQVNTSGSSSTPPPSGPAVEYDKHGRPVPQPPQQAAAPPHGDPLLGEHSTPPAPTAPVLDPSAAAIGDPPAGPPVPPVPPVPPSPPVSAAPPTTPGVPPAEPPSGRPAPIEAASPPPTPPLPGAPSTEHDDPNAPSYAPPKLTGGDPLAG